jgi:hypothetical protein
LGVKRLNPITPELIPSAQRCQPRFLLEILIFKGLTARRLFKSFDVKGLTPELKPSSQRSLPRIFTGVLVYKWLTERRIYKSF